MRGLLSIDPLTGREKEDDSIQDNIHDNFIEEGSKEDTLERDSNDEDLLNQPKLVSKADNDLEVRMINEQIVRRETPMEQFVIDPIVIQRSKTVKEKKQPKLKGFEIEKWVDSGFNDTNSQKRKPSPNSPDNNRVLDIISKSNAGTFKSKEFYSRHSDSLHLEVKSGSK